VSNSLVHPVVAAMRSVPELQPNPDEVDEVVFVPLSSLMSEAALREELWTLGGRQVPVPYWEVHRIPLWGATAMILSELVTVYREYHELFG